MRLDDLHVDIVAQNGRRHLDQFERDVHPNAHVGCHDNRDFASRGFDGRTAVCIEPGGTDHHASGRGTTHMKGSECRFRDAEVDQRVELVNHGGKIIADEHAKATKPGQLARVSAYSTVSLPFQGGAQAYSIAFRQRLYQRTTHTASRTGDSNIDHG